MPDIAEWTAPIATMIAAMMTAANLGARLTGWGFVVFALGSICWTLVGVSTGQVSLVVSNGFLTVVNLIGIWRWLGRQRAYEDGGKSAETASRKSSTPTLFTATGLAGRPVVGREGEAIGKAVEALIECHSGEVSYIVVASGGAGGVGEKLRAVSREAVIFHCDALKLDLARPAFEALPELAPGDWPGSANTPMADAA